MSQQFSNAIDERLTTADRILNQLSDAILRGELGPGEKLSEPELARQLGTSRAPLREAIRRLEERKLVTRAPHVGARVMSLAGPSEVLLSGVLKDLVPASGFGFEDRGSQVLKGIGGSWRLFAVTAVDGQRRPVAAQSDSAGAKEVPQRILQGPG